MITATFKVARVNEISVSYVLFARIVDVISIITSSCHQVICFLPRFGTLTGNTWRAMGRPGGFLTN